MTTTTILEQTRRGERPVMVSLMHRGAEREQTPCSLEEAKELLSRKTVNGFHYAIRPNQFQETGGEPQDYLDGLAEEVARLVLAS